MVKGQVGAGPFKRIKALTNSFRIWRWHRQHEESIIFTSLVSKRILPRARKLRGPACESEHESVSLDPVNFYYYWLDDL